MVPVQTSRPLRLASRMQRLGTETAFEVLVRARALEKQGKHIVHLEIGEPDFDTPKNIGCGCERTAYGLHPLWTVRGTGRPAGSHCGRCFALAGSKVYARGSSRRTRRKADHLLHTAGTGGRG